MSKKKTKGVSFEEYACSYAALILADDDVTITPEKISTILNAAGVTVESIWPSMYAKALSGINIRQLITNVGQMSAMAGVDTPATSKTAEEKKVEEKKEEPTPEVEEDSDEDFGFGLFD